MELRRKLINNLLRHEGLVAVPTDWEKEYVKLAGDKIRNKQTIQELIKEYNLLLRDYYEKHTIKELTEILKNAGLEGSMSQLNKEQLIQLAVEEYKMFWKKD